jgi:uncharacterized SAM-binding protein YcdF (DUF218 family)
MKKRRLFIACSIIGISILSLFLIYGGRFLIYKKSSPVVGKSVIVVLMGSLPDRALETARVYKEKPGASVLYVSPIDPAKHFLDSINVPIPSTAKSFHDALLNLNVKGQDIVYLRGPGFSTQDEAFYISRYLKQDSTIGEVLIVSSSFHSRRAYLVFQDRFEKAGLKITINVSPSRYTDFNPNYWYTRKADAAVVATEWMKLIYYLFVGQFQ